MIDTFTARSFGDQMDMSDVVKPVWLAVRQNFQGAQPDQFVAYFIPRARRYDIDADRQDVAEDILVQTDGVWEIYGNNLGQTPLPQVENYIQDQYGVGWKIIHIKAKMYGSVYELFVKKFSGWKSLVPRPVVQLTATP
jgi:hypothetical protein